MKRCRVSFLVVIAVLSVVCGVFGENAIENGNFDNRTIGWVKWGGMSSENGRNGKWCAKIKNHSKKWSGLHQIVPLPDSVDRVMVSGWMKTDSVIQGEKDWEKARIAVEFIDKEEEVVGNYPPLVGGASGTTDWKYYKKLIPVEKSAHAVKLQLALGNAEGTAYFDDINLEFLSGIRDFPKDTDSLGNQVIAPGFEDYMRAWTRYGADAAGGGRSGDFSLYINNISKRRSGAYQKIVLPANTDTVVVSGYVKTEGVESGSEEWHKARINPEFYDESGSVTADTLTPVCALTGSNEWKKYKREYIPGKSDRVLKLVCGLPFAQGKVWFDDISCVLKDSSGEVIREKVWLTGPVDKGEWYELGSDFSSGGHYVDWSSLLDPPAGKHGFLKAEKGELFFEDGTRAKFWGTNLVAGDIFRSHEKMDSLASRLSKMGMNMLRLHHMDAPWADKNIFGKSGTTRKLSEEALERLDYLVYRLKEKGIYVFMDFLVHRQFYKEDGVEHMPPERGAKQVGFFNDKIIELQKEYIEQLMTHKNQYTGVKYVNEPAVAASEFINESNLFTHFSSNLLEGSVYWDELNSKWKQEGHKKDLPLFKFDWSTGEGILDTDSDRADLSEAIKFIYRTEKNYYNRMKSFTDTLGIKYPLAGSNFPDPILASLYSNASLDLMLSNEYWDHPQVWEIDDDYSRVYESPFENRSQLISEEDGLIKRKAWYRLSDKPYIITEWNHCYPNEYVLEGVPLIAAYGAFQGWDGVLQFDFNHDMMGNSRIRNYTLSVTPEELALQAAAAPMFLRGYIKEGKEVFTEPVSDSSVFTMPSYSPLLDTFQLLPFAKKYGKEFSDEEMVTPKGLEKYMDGGVVTSSTDELEFDSDNGYVRINSPFVQGAFGFLKDIKTEFPFMEFKCGNPHFALIAVSADTMELKKSERVYLVAAGPTKMKGQVYDPSRTVLLDQGRLPVMAQVIQGRALFKGVGEKDDISVYPLSPDGERGKEIELEKGDAGIKLDLSKGRSFVYEILIDRE